MALATSPPASHTPEDAPTPTQRDALLPERITRGVLPRHPLGCSLKKKVYFLPE